MREWSVRSVVLGLLSFLAMTAVAAPSASNRLEFSAAYARASMPGQEVGAAYVTIQNQGTEDDFLVGAQSPLATEVDIHTSTLMQGMAHMQRQSRLRVPAMGKLEMKPGGVHLMLQGLKQPLKEGDQVEMRLDFEKAGQRLLKLPVRAVLSGQGKSSGAMPMDMPMSY